MSPDKPLLHRGQAVLTRHIPPPPAVALPSVVKRTVHAGQGDDDESNPSPLSPIEAQERSVAVRMVVDVARKEADHIPQQAAVFKFERQGVERIDVVDLEEQEALRHWGKCFC